MEPQKTFLEKLKNEVVDFLTFDYFLYALLVTLFTFVLVVAEEFTRSGNPNFDFLLEGETLLLLFVSITAGLIALLYVYLGNERFKVNGVLKFLVIVVEVVIFYFFTTYANSISINDSLSIYIYSFFSVILSVQIIHFIYRYLFRSPLLYIGLSLMMLVLLLDRSSSLNRGLELVDFIVAISVTLVFFVFFALIAYRKQKGLSLKDVLVSYIGMPILMTLFFSVGVYALGTIFNNLELEVDNAIDDRLSEVEEQEEEPGESDRRELDPDAPAPTPGPGEDGETDLAFDQRSDEATIRLIGYVKADEPQYMKIDTYRLKGAEDGFTVVEYDHDSTYDPFYYLEAEIQDEDGIERMEVIYTYSPKDYLLPTTGNVVYTDKDFVDDNDVILESESTSSSKVKYDFYYIPNNYGDNYNLRGTEDEVSLEEAERNIQLANIYTPFNYDSEADDSSTFDESSDRYDEVKALTERVTAGYDTDLEKAKAVEQYLINNYEYSYDPKIDDQDFPIDDFLLDTKRGYCTHFAAGMTYMLETIGIDARFTVGFYSDTYDPNLDAYLILSNGAHAWTEVYIEGQWVAFEPTTDNLADDMKSSSQITGANAEAASIEELKINYDFNYSNPRTGFDNIFANDPNELEPYDYDEENSQWDEKDEGNEDGDGEDDQDQEEEEEEPEDEDREIDESIYWIVGAIGLGLLICGAGVAFYVWYSKRKSKSERIEEKVRHIDMNIRNQIWSKAKERDADLSIEKVYRLSPKDFLNKVSKLGIDSNNIKEAYMIIDRLLYSQDRLNESDLEHLKRVYLIIKQEMTE